MQDALNVTGWYQWYKNPQFHWEKIMDTNFMNVLADDFPNGVNISVRSIQDPMHHIVKMWEGIDCIQLGVYADQPIQAGAFIALYDVGGYVHCNHGIDNICADIGYEYCYVYNVFGINVVGNPLVSSAALINCCSKPEDPSNVRLQPMLRVMPDKSLRCHVIVVATTFINVDKELLFSYDQCYNTVIADGFVDAQNNRAPYREAAKVAFEERNSGLTALADAAALMQTAPAALQAAAPAALMQEPAVMQTSDDDDDCIFIEEKKVIAPVIDLTGDE